MGGSILYIGGSHPQRLAVRTLRDWGFDVHVTDRNPAPPCAAETPHTHCVDAADVDGLVALSERLRESGSFVGAYGIADYAMPGVAAVNLGIAGRAAPSAAIETMIDKDATKAALQRGGVPLPQTLWAGDADRFEPDACPAPEPGVRELIVKPADVHASRGIGRVVCGDPHALMAAVREASRNARRVLVEAYLEGDIWNVDALAVDGVVHGVSVTRRVAHPTLAFLPCLQIQPRWADEEWFESLTALAQKIADSLCYTDGPFTADLIMTAQGPRVLEVSPHFHSIGLEILRGNGNPLRGWARCLAGDPGWMADLQPRDERAGALAMLRAEEVGMLTGIAGEDAISDDPRCRDYVRMKPDGAEIASLSAGGGLLALAWWADTDGCALGDGLLSAMNRFVPEIVAAGDAVA